jgi:ribosomal protein S12 methylthiotransferase
LGVFTYSHEEDTFAYRNYSDDIDPEIKEERMSRIMELQQEISLEINQQKIGKKMPVLIDRQEGEFYIGRSQGDSPEVDGEVMVKSTKPIQIGSFIEVDIYDADEFDLYGEII